MSHHEEHSGTVYVTSFIPTERKALIKYKLNMLKHDFFLNEEEMKKVTTAINLAETTVQIDRVCMATIKEKLSHY